MLMMKNTLKTQVSLTLNGQSGSFTAGIAMTLVIKWERAAVLQIEETTKIGWRLVLNMDKLALGGSFVTTGARIIQRLLSLNLAKTFVAFVISFI